MESMRNRMRSRRLRGLVLHHRRHPSAHPRRLVTRTASWGEPPVTRRLSLVPRAHRRHTPHLARLLPRGLPRRIRTEATRHPGHDVRGMRRVLPRSSTTGSPSTSPGRWDPRRSGERSHWRTSTGSAARATGARPGWTAGSRGSSRPARSTGEEPGGPGDSTAPGRACSSLLSG